MSPKKNPSVAAFESEELPDPASAADPSPWPTAQAALP